MPITSIRNVAGFRKNGAPLLVKKKALEGNQLIVYEPNSKQINCTGITGPFSLFFTDSVDSETAIGIGKQEIDMNIEE